MYYEIYLNRCYGLFVLRKVYFAKWKHMNHCQHRDSNPDIPLDVYSLIQGCSSIELYIAWNLCILKLYKILRFSTQTMQTRYTCLFINLQEKRCCLSMYASTAGMVRWLKMKKSKGWKKSSALCVRSSQSVNKPTQLKHAVQKVKKNMTSELFYVLVSFILLSQKIKVVWIQTLRLNFFDLKANDLNVVCSSHF